MPEKKQGRGGKREGAGRPKVEEKRKQRAICFFDEEWEIIRQKAEARKLSIRAYLCYLAEKDRP